MTGATTTIADATDILPGNPLPKSRQRQPGRAAARKAKTTDQ